MMKQTGIVLVLCCTWALGALAQVNCATSNKLTCLIPFNTRATQPGTAGNQAQAFNAAFAAQLSQLPIPSSATGVIVVKGPNGEDRYLEDLGPILTDRARTIGKHRLFLGFSFQQFNFTNINGNNLGQVPIVLISTTQGTNGQGMPATIDQYTAQSLNISFKFNQYVGIVTYGLTAQDDISLIVPAIRVSLSSGQVVYGPSGYLTQYNVDHATQQLLYTIKAKIPTLSGVASGVGDILANYKHEFSKTSKTRFAAGFLVRFPTGDSLNYLGSGAYGFNPYAVVSYDAAVSPHARLGYIWNGTTDLIQTTTGSPSGNCPPSCSNPARLPGGLQYDIGVDAKVIQRVSIAVDLLGNQYQNSPTLVPTTLTIPPNSPPTPPPIATLPNTVLLNSTYTINDFSVGFKWRPFNRENSSLNGLLVYGNALFQLNNVGLRTEPVPLAGISYTFCSAIAKCQK
jgi:hypothetical protein